MSNTPNVPGNLPAWMRNYLVIADHLAAEAKACRTAGDFRRASLLDARFDAIHAEMDLKAAIQAAQAAIENLRTNTQKGD